MDTWPARSLLYASLIAQTPDLLQLQVRQSFLDPPFLTTTCNVLDSLIQTYAPRFAASMAKDLTNTLAESDCCLARKKKFKPCRAAQSEACVKPRLCPHLLLVLCHIITRTCIIHHSYMPSRSGASYTRRVQHMHTGPSH